IGRRSSLDVDIDKIKTEIQAVKTYFNSTDATEFCYTFDDDSLSFEEQAGMVASACFCEAIRFGNKLRLKFEKPQASSVLLFNHRNKVSSSEKRTYKIGNDKDYDGVELEYTSPDDDKRITYSVPESITLTNALKITTSGIRNHAVAKTRAWREWNKLEYQNVDCEFEALDESELLIRNDRILVANGTDLKTQDGEIIAVDGLILTCSMDVDFEDGEQYYCCLQIADGSVDIIECTAGEYTNQIILNHAPTMALVVGTDRYVKTLYSITKVAETSSQAFMLSEMSRNTQMTNKLTCINYDDRYYEKDHSFL
ncbi:host specificity factor TipJ family phage tail protein, partial [Acinetobacter guillouiae]|uniref:host specificity factor TipJ family phage tail protein n=1 Tax=Acinetobacter guillouiae TaxID=106649 RepID=UPI0012F96009